MKTCQHRRHKRREFNLWVGKLPWSRKWQPTPVFLPGKPHGQRSLAVYSPWGHKKLNKTEHTHTHTTTTRECLVQIFFLPPSPLLFFFFFWLLLQSIERFSSLVHKPILLCTVLMSNSRGEPLCEGTVRLPCPLNPQPFFLDCQQCQLVPHVV